MDTADSSKAIRDAVAHLQESYTEYMASLERVLDFGEANVRVLVAALNNKHANPVAQALGLMMHTPTAEQAIPVLLDWLVVQCSLYPDVPGSARQVAREGASIAERAARQIRR